VFETYSRQMYEEPFAWIASHDIFPDGEIDAGCEDALLSLRR
jgi:hypothetical protein